MGIRFSPLLGVLAAPLLLAALCGDRGPVNEKMLVHQQACAAYLKQGDLDAANARCQLCLDFDERNPECLYDLGLVAWQRGNVALARELIIKALRENEDFGQARNALGRMALDDGDVDGAIGFFARAVEVDPHYLEGRKNLALAYLRKGMRVSADGGDPSSSFDSAELEYRKLFEIAPNDPAPARDMGVLMTLKADRAPREKQATLLKDAEVFFVHCLALEPSSKECHGNLAHLFTSTGRFDEAVAHAEACVAVDADDPLCGAELKNALEQRARRGDAR